MANEIEYYIVTRYIPLDVLRDYDIVEMKQLSSCACPTIYDSITELEKHITSVRFNNNVRFKILQYSDPAIDNNEYLRLFGNNTSWITLKEVLKRETINAYVRELSTVTYVRLTRKKKDDETRTNQESQSQ